MFTALFLSFFCPVKIYRLGPGQFIPHGQKCPYRTRSILTYLHKMYLLFLFLFRKKRKKLTTFEISQLIENEGIFVDDSDLDPDYMEAEFDPSSESSGEEWQRDNGKRDKVVRPDKRYRLKVYCKPKR